MKTNAVRLLETLGIQYELREYEVDPDDLAAETVAAKIGLPPEQVFKTLLARGDRHGLCFAVIPANTELDLKALAAATGDRKLELVPVKELLALTGYIRGGVTVLGARKAFPVFADETIQCGTPFPSLPVFAGRRSFCGQKTIYGLQQPSWLISHVENSCTLPAHSHDLDLHINLPNFSLIAL
jgi:Cys-tRNA(Pro)/Cys-tRNA(Cys) deacylase